MSAGPGAGDGGAGGAPRALAGDRARAALEGGEAPAPARALPRPGRELPLFPVTVVGSLPRSDAVRRALRERARGRLDDAAFAAVADPAVEEALALQEASGVEIVSDGEARRESFLAFVARRLDGVRLLRLSEMLDLVDDKAAFDRLLAALDVPAFAIQNPVVDGRVAARGALAADEVAFVAARTRRPIKVALPGPYLLTRAMWLRRLSGAVYPTKEALADDVVRVLRDEVARVRAAGASFVQLDEPALTEVAFAGPHATHTFMCAALSEKASPEDELAFAVELVNRVVEGAEGIRTGVHVCRGNWSRRDDVLLAGPYDALMPWLARMRVDQLVLEYATPRAGGLDALAALPPEREVGLGVVDPRTSEVEHPDAIVARVREALRVRAPETLFLNPDCGFGTFADRPVSTPALAAAKLAAIRVAALRLRDGSPPRG